MNKRLEELKSFIDSYSTAPSLENMPRRTLEDKCINGATGAHVIEEVHVPYNFDYITVTTGTTAFQNIVAVLSAEIPDRISASCKVFNLAGIPQGSRVLFTYAPLVNVFTKAALEAHNIRPVFLKSSGRDALIYALCAERPSAVVGESSFMRLGLEDAKKLGFSEMLPKDIPFLAAGTPLDTELIDTARSICGGKVYDLYGCQEFGWLTLNGIPLREDIELVPDNDDYALIAGGLPTGDSFPLLDSGHICGGNGKIITYGRRRSHELEVKILATTAAAYETVERLARGILRIKARIVRVANDVQLNAPETILALHAPGESEYSAVIQGKTGIFDALLTAQQEYQQKAKTDPAWIKRR